MYSHLKELYGKYSKIEGVLVEGDMMMSKEGFLHSRSVKDIQCTEKEPEIKKNSN